jgi:hypothetical protein
MDLNLFIDDRMNQYATAITKGGAKADEHAIGELTFYAALRRVVGGKGTPQDLGMMDAVNDLLQAKGLVAKGETFFK